MIISIITITKTANDKKNDSNKATIGLGHPTSTRTITIDDRICMISQLPKLTRTLQNENMIGKSNYLKHPEKYS